MVVLPLGCGFCGKVGAAKEERGGVVPIGHKQRYVAQAMTQATPRLPKSRSRYAFF